ncbi:MAG TPA: hypothetical protein VF821_35890 [Lentzea sp.]
MSKNRSLRRGTTAVALAVAAVAGGLFSQTAHAANPPHVQCRAGGPSAQDNALASALAGRMTHYLRGDLDGEKISCARAIYEATLAKGYPGHAALIEIDAAITEARLLNQLQGDASSVGLFQMLDDKGTVQQRTNVPYEVNWFLNTMNQFYPRDSWLNKPIWEVAQGVERSAFPDRYQPNAADAKTILDGIIEQASSDRAYPLFHETRNGTNGAWSGFLPLPGFGGASNFEAHEVATAGFADGSAQYLATGTDKFLYHNIRNADGSWQGWNRMPGNAGSAQFQAGNVTAAATPNGDLNVFAIGNDGFMYHNVRKANGAWDAWHAMPGAGTTFFQAKSLTATGMTDNSVQIVANGPDGVLYHNIRRADGSWQGWNRIGGFNGAGEMSASTLAMASRPGSNDIQLVATGNK